jgi:hypothetical protein
MPTDNPKVSAYVPQLIKDRVTQFRQEQGISESQAVTIILAEYFGLNQLLVRSPGESAVGGVTLARMEATEQRLTTLTQTLEDRFRQLEEAIAAIKSNSNSPMVHSVTQIPEIKFAATEPASNLSSVIVSELPKEPEVQQGSLYTESLLEFNDTQVELSKELEPKANEQTIISLVESVQPEKNSQLNLLGKPDSRLPLKPLTGKVIAKRLGYHPDSLSKLKSKFSEQEFQEFSSRKDKDKIVWSSSQKGKGYLPASELTEEQYENLMTWLNSNAPEYFV